MNRAAIEEHPVVYISTHGRKLGVTPRIEIRLWPDDERIFLIGRRSGAPGTADRRASPPSRRREARGACPDQGGDEPQVPPVERVDERAVQQDPEPGAEERRRADPVGVVPLDRVLERPAERREHQREDRDQPEHALLGQGARVIVPRVLDSGHVYHLFPVLAEHRDELQQHLQSHNVETLIHYPVPIPRQPALAATDPAMCAIADRVCATVLSLPMYPALTDDDVTAVAAGVRSFQG